MFSTIQKDIINQHLFLNLANPSEISILGSQLGILLYNIGNITSRSL